MKEEKPLSVHGDSFTLLIEKEKIKEKIESIAEKIKKDAKEENPLFLCVLKGAFIFMADLVRAYPGHCEVSFIRLASYQGTQSSGNVKTLLGITDNLKGRFVVIVEDIVDTGKTMKYLIDELKKQEPKCIKLAALFTKPENMQCKVHIDYPCFNIPNKFIVGYGLDFDGLYRNFPDIYTKD